MDHPQAPHSAFWMEKDGIHFMSIEGSGERTDWCAADSDGMGMVSEPLVTEVHEFSQGRA